MLSTTLEKNTKLSCLSLAEREVLAREIAALVGERFTVESRLQWINKRVDELRVQLAEARTHGNAKEK